MPKASPWMPALGDMRTGKDTPRAFLERCIARIEAQEPELKAFVCADPPAARAAADASTRRWQAGAPLSPIDGMPVGVKDIIETADMPTGMGSPLFEGWRSQRDSASVHALREAGAVIVGKTVTTEFAASEPGPTRNPWDLARTPGGSSSGSAAGAAAGFFSAGLGTQVIGSILRPASYCGVFGFKPSFGAINRGGSHDYMSQSSQGVIAASLEDVYQVAREIVDRCGGDPGYPGMDGPPALPRPATPRRLAFLETDGWASASETARAAALGARSSLEAAGVEVIDRGSSPKVAAAERALEGALPLSLRMNAWESRWPLNTYRDRDASKLSPSSLQRAMDGEAMTLSEYRDLLARRDAACSVWNDLAGTVDAAITLSAAGCAPLGLRSTGNAAFVVTGSLLRTPAISLPALQDSGLPLGLQMLGFPGRDADLFALAGWVMQRLSEGLRA